jgi:protein-S-isoprenylcysteine O-methyltransferase Ste14
MLAILNFVSFILASIASTILYVMSVSPAQSERQIGEESFFRCTRYRMAALVFMGLAVINFILCRSLPLANWLATPFSWPRWVSFTIALLLGLPALALAVTGVQDLGSEWLTPASKNKLVTAGIYQHIRHPQAFLALLWMALSFGLHSPFLLILSVPMILIEFIMVMAEETDLAIRYREPYLKYREKTGMFFPKGKGSWDYFSKYHKSFKKLFNNYDDDQQ